MQDVVNTQNTSGKRPHSIKTLLNFESCQMTIMTTVIIFLGTFQKHIMEQYSIKQDAILHL